MRRVFALVLLVVSAVLLTGCAGVDGQKAAALLVQADAAQKALTSEQFSMRMNMDAAGQTVALQMAGGGYLKGAQAGDVYMTMTGQTPDGKSLDATIVKHGDTVTVSSNGRTEVLSAAQAQQQLGGQLQSMVNGGFNFAQYVKSVKVSDTTGPDGDPADQIVGVLDTQGAANSLTQGLGLSGLGKLGDTRAVLTISRKTHLVTSALIDMSMEILGKKMTISLTYGLTGANVPINFPRA
jgi:outer membrane lipoprotein-sorting protein